MTTGYATLDARKIHEWLASAGPFDPRVDWDMHRRSDTQVLFLRSLYGTFLQSFWRQRVLETRNIINNFEILCNEATKRSETESIRPHFNFLRVYFRAAGEVLRELNKLPPSQGLRTDYSTVVRLEFSSLQRLTRCKALQLEFFREKRIEFC